MDKRFVSFLMLSMLVMVGYMLVRAQFAPPPPPPGVAQGEAEVAPEAGEQGRAPRGDDLPQPGEDSDDGADETPATDTDTDEPDESPEPAIGAGEETDAARPAVAQQWLTLGSVDPQSPYRLLLTFTNRGAALQRAELSSPEYRDLEDTRGYLGNLALTDAKQCARINVVGHGTPAAGAQCTQGERGTGLRSGDVIVQVNGTKLDSGPLQGYADHCDELLGHTEPGQTLTLRVRPADAPAGSGKLLTYTAQLTPPPMEVIQPERKDIHDPTSPWQPLSFLTSFSRMGEETIGSPTSGFSRQEIAGLPSLRESNWEVLKTDSPDEVAFRFVLNENDLKQINQAGRVEIIKRFRLAKTDKQDGEPASSDPAYHVTMSLEVRNLGQETKLLGLQQNGPTGLPLEGWWYIRKGSPHWGAAGMHDVVWRSTDGTNKLFRTAVIVENAQQEPPEPTLLFTESPVMRYCGGDGPYFSAVMLPDEDAPGYAPDKYRFQYGEGMVVGEIYEGREQDYITGTTFRLITYPQSIKPGEAFEQQYTVFIGPKQPELLAAYGLEDTIVFGWPIFAVVAEVLLWLLHGIYFVVRNYGVAIILLTVLVRLAVYPIGRKQAQNAAKMQELAPEMKAIAEKYKDMEQRAKAQQDLFRRHNYNPLGGCWLMFLQLPIFIGLYKALSVSIDLRQAPLIPGLSWCSNLAGPDMLIRWDTLLGEGITGPEGFLAFLTAKAGYLGPYLNILPLVTIALFIVHQKLFTPPATDEQQQLQQKMMSFMMIFMGFLFFKVPSGLCLYFITSSLWGIAERKLLPKTPKKDDTSQADITKGDGKKPDGKKAPAKKQGANPLAEKMADVLAMFDKKPASNGAGDKAKGRARRKKKKRK